MASKKELKEALIAAQTALAEKEAEEAEAGAGNGSEEEGETYSLNEEDLNKLINERITEYAKKAPKGQPAFVPKKDKDAKPTYRKLEMKRS